MIEQNCKDCGTVHNRAFTDCVIPSAPYYVMSRDPFFSNVRNLSEGIINTPVVPCADYAEAERVYNYVLGRRDQKNVRVVARKPRHRPGRVLNIVSAWKRPSERTDD